MDIVRIYMIILVTWSQLTNQSLCRSSHRRRVKNYDVISGRSLGTRRNLRSIVIITQGCDHGCPECNAYSGCTRCRRGMYLTLVQDGRVTRAVCVHKCPAGYFGEKTPTSGICQSCRVSNCKACFHRSYCTVCEPGFFLHLGKCESNCPGHLFSNNHTGKCEEAVDCVVSPWTAFGKCNPSRRPNAMSCKYGRKKRNRTILQPPSPGGAKCPKLTHSRKCRVTDCPPINNWARNEWIKMKRRKERRKQREGRRRNRNRNEISNNSAAKLVRKNRRKSHKKRKSSTSST